MRKGHRGGIPAKGRYAIEDDSEAVEGNGVKRIGRGVHLRQSRWKYLAIFAGVVGVLSWWQIASNLASGEMSFSDFLMLLVLVTICFVLAIVHGILIALRANRLGDAHVSIWRVSALVIGIFVGMIGGAFILQNHESITGWALVATSAVCQVGGHLPIRRWRELPEATT